VTSFYLGAGRPPLVVDDWGDIVSAVQVGLTRETQWCELKLNVPASSPAANAELARDMASLTVGGGVLLIGVKDNAATAADVVGVLDADLPGLVSRISQVASSRVSPPMHVLLHEIADPSGTGHIVLVVEVPTSATAPHMVDGTYWGRSATGKQPLGDHDVTRLIREREGRGDRFVAELAAMANDVDPLGPDRRARGRLYLMAQPVAAMSVRLGAATAAKRMLELVVDALPDQSQHHWVSLYELRYDIPHASGRAAASDEQSEWDLSREESLIYALLRDDGAVKYVSGATVRLYDDEPCISLAGVCETVRQVAQLAAHLSTEYLAYSGPWPSLSTWVEALAP